VTGDALGGLIVGVTSPAPREAWLAVLAADPNALVSQTPDWLDCICASGTYEDASRLYETGNGRRLVLPLVRRRGLPGPLAIEASLPWGWGIGGLLAPGGPQAEEIAAVVRDLARRRVLRISLRTNPVQAALWAGLQGRGIVAVPRLSHTLDLEGGFATVWSQRFTHSARGAVRKAERAGLRVERDTSGRLLPVYHTLYERSLSRWAEQQHEPPWLARWRGERRDSPAKLQAILRTLGERAQLWVAWLGERAAAAIVVLQGANASYARGVMDKELAGPTRANYLLQRLAIEDACRAGCRYYHMGESGASQSLAQYKTRFGAVAQPNTEYKVERLPLTAMDRALRGLVKRIIGFRDVWQPVGAQRPRPATGFDAAHEPDMGPSWGSEPDGSNAWPGYRHDAEGDESHLR